MSNIAPEGDYNPYAAPTAEAGPPVGEKVGEATPEDEATRRAHLGREASIRAIGLFGYVLAFLFALWPIVLLGIAIYIVADKDLGSLLGLDAGVGAMIGVVHLLMGYFFYKMGDGLRRLEAGARWAWVVVAGIGAIIGFVGPAQLLNQGDRLGAFAIFTLYAALAAPILFFLLTPPAAALFTAHYRGIVARTPEIKPRSPWWAKLATFGIVLAVHCLLVYTFSVRR